jgi:predicted NAD/FAD-binding protein
MRVWPSQSTSERFDDVVFATHTDTTLQLLGEGADPAERAVLGGVPYNDNDIYLHTGE